MIDHDAIAARVRQDRKAGTPGPWVSSFESVDPEWAIVTTNGGAVVANVNADSRQEANARRAAFHPDLEDAYLDLYDEVQRLRAALEIITMMHDGNPPLPLADMPCVEYARRTIRNIHQEARAALKGTSE